ncbi:MAG: hypothetical protein JXR95_13680 [Deltaproteobacteria bacterium]|nr:hypothetical protein [Deltaproteobacteria bacterium]
MKLKSVYLLSVSFILVGCGSSSSLKVHTPPLRHSAANVKVMDKYPAGCTAGKVIQAMGSAEAPGRVVWRYAMNDLRNKASDEGLDTVVLEKYESKSSGGVLMVSVHGRALLCNGKKSPKNKGYIAGKQIRRKPKTIYDTVEPTAPPAPQGNLGTPQPSDPEGNPPSDDGAPEGEPDTI